MCAQTRQGAGETQSIRPKCRPLASFKGQQSSEKDSGYIISHMAPVTIYGAEYRGTVGDNVRFHMLSSNGFHHGDRGT